MRWLLYALAISAFAQNNDWRIVPGERIGPVTAATTRADLPRLFPGAPAKDDEIELAEGVLEPATQIADLSIVWSAKERDAHPARVFICRRAKTNILPVADGRWDHARRSPRPA